MKSIRLHQDIRTEPQSFAFALTLPTVFALIYSATTLIAIQHIGLGASTLTALIGVTCAIGSFSTEWKEFREKARQEQ